MIQTELSQSNQRELRKLILSIRANANRLDLLLAICDDRNLQEDLIQHYEAELKQQGIATHRTRLDLRQPSLKATLAALVQREPGLQTQDQAVVTVLGASELLGVRLTDEKSEQEKFFFSLQWTRESLRDFHFPVVVWLSEAIATGLSRQAQDFWSWRSGVFEFETDSQLAVTPELVFNQASQLDFEQNERQTSSIQDLQQQIAELEQQNPRSPLLVTLYNDLGDAYRQQYAFEPALQVYEQALNLAQILKDQAGRARSLGNLGLALYHSGRYAKAIAFYEQALVLYQEMGDLSGEAAFSGNLGNIYRALGQYQRAIDFYQRSLDIAHELGASNGEANALMWLGNAYQLLGQYQRAIDFHQQALAIQRCMGDRDGEGGSLCNLGNTYQALGQYPQAIELYQQALKIQRNVGNQNFESNSLLGLGYTYLLVGQYQRAIDFSQQGLVIKREIGDRSGEASALINLGNTYYLLKQYQQAIDFHQQALEMTHELGDRCGESSSLVNLGNTYSLLDRYEQAIDFYQRALAIKQEIGDRHGEANALFSRGYALARLDRHYEALQSYQQALVIYEDLKLDHEVEQCKTAIAGRSKIIVFERRTAPKIGNKQPSDELFTKPISEQRLPSRSTWQVLMWVAIALLIWWLRR